MGWIHPCIAAVTFLGALSVMWSGWKRFCVNELGQKKIFPWKKHVSFGSITLALWAFCTVSGLIGARLVWGSFFIAGPHAIVGLAMFPLILVGYLTGRTLNIVKKRRKYLPLLHGINNALLLLLAFWQIYTGWPLLDTL